MTGMREAFGGALERVRVVELSEWDKAWISWKVVMPLAMTLLLFAAYKWVMLMKHPFEKAFAHGELMMFAALLMIEAALEESQSDTRGHMYAINPVIMVLSVLVLFTLGLTKQDMMLQETALEHAAGPEIEFAASARLKGYGILNVLSAMTAVFIAVGGLLGSRERRLKSKFGERPGEGT